MMYQREASMVGIKTATTCAFALIAAILIARQAYSPSARAERPNEQATPPNSVTTAPLVTGRNGEFLGAAPDAHTRSFLMENEFLE
jgi:hypothetical protein